MSLISMFFGKQPYKPQNGKDKAEKFKRLFEENVAWVEPSFAILPDDRKHISLDDLAIIGRTSSREINGMVENKLRVNGFDSPEDFFAWKVMLSDRDDFFIAITRRGMAMLSRLGLKPVAKQQTKH